MIVDGTGLSMPGTHENQSEWPQQSSQTIWLRVSSSSTLRSIFPLFRGAYDVWLLQNRELAEVKRPEFIGGSVI